MPSAVATTITKTPRAESQRAHEDAVEESESIPTHPLGVKPLGNQYFSEGVNARNSVGSWKSLPDEMIMIIFEHLDAVTLFSLGHTCKFFYAFCHSEELWKALFLR